MNINHTPSINGKSSAVCCCCGGRSRPAKTDNNGEPTLWNMARGWSEAPFPHDYVHPDGSTGSMYTCPSCNKQLRAGVELTMRNGFKQRRAGMSQSKHVAEHFYAIAGQIADIAARLDYLKNMADPTLAQSAQADVDALHDIAALLAGSRANELYVTDDEADALLLAIAAGTACCCGEVSAGPGWAAVEGAMA